MENKLCPGAGKSLVLIILKTLEANRRTGIIRQFVIDRLGREVWKK